jgi:hypothetical protein
MVALVTYIELLHPGVDHFSDYSSGMECPSGGQVTGRVVASTYYENQPGPTRRVYCR